MGETPPGDMEGAAAEDQGTLFLEETLAEDDSVYNLDCDADALKKEGWKTDPKFFKKVRVSAAAAIKMSIHAHWGAEGREVGDGFMENEDAIKKKFEVMGYLQGKVDGDTFVILDSFPVNAQYSETAVEINQTATEQQVRQVCMSPGVGRTENVRGWYHTHPGLTLFFSNVDVLNQLHCQHTYNLDPYIALVCEPVQMLNLKTVRIGAFRVFPKGYSGEPHSDSTFDKDALWADAPQVYKPIEGDLKGANETYYRLPVEIFKSKMDNDILHKLFSADWAKSLAAPAFVSEELKTMQMKDLADRLDKVPASQSSGPAFQRARTVTKDKSSLAGIAQHAKLGSTGQLHDMMTAVIKNSLFN